jgi:hypothetical protein
VRLRPGLKGSGGCGPCADEGKDYPGEALKSSWIAALALISVGVLSGGAVDDPPPEPVTCPLCAGDPQVHVRKTFEICTTAAELATVALRW